MNYLWLVLLWVASLTGGLALALRSGDAYSPHDAEEHATEFGGGMREAHGPVTAFLWLTYAVVLIFSVIYTIVHWSDFSMMFRMM